MAQSLGTRRDSGIQGVYVEVTPGEDPWGQGGDESDNVGPDEGMYGTVGARWELVAQGARVVWHQCTR